MRFAFLGFIIMCSLVVHAQEADCETTTEKELRPMIEVAAVAADETTCPNRNKMKNICMFVGSRTADPTPMNDRLQYMYQRRMLEAACADVSKDSEAEIATKMQKMWATFENELICNNLAFDVKDGSVLKYGATTKFDAFIYDIIKWKIPLNKVDPTDNRTLLDYIQFQIERNAGTSIEKKLRTYYKQLKDAGAKHKAEL